MVVITRPCGSDWDRICYTFGVVLGGVFAGKYIEVYKVRMIPCNTGDNVYKRECCKPNGARLKAHGTRKKLSSQ